MLRFRIKLTTQRQVALRTLVLLPTLALMLAACGDNPPVSVNGECKAFQRVAIEACGLTIQDQSVLDDYVETGVSACKWQRPQPRTPSCADLRAEIAQLRTEKAKTTVMPVKAPPMPKKKSLLQRVFRR